MKYAIGEILLVVIGILLALQINNWNEDRKNRNILQNYYQQIIRDLNINIEYSNNKLRQIDLSIIKYELYNQPIPNDLDVTGLYERIQINDLYIYRVDFQSDIINSLISTVDIKLFDPELQEKLTT